MNILSLFDGISGARIALEKSNIPITNYYASEIDKYAIQVSKENYPDIIHLGDIKDIKASDLPQIDLIIGGSPCQDLSNAGQRKRFSDTKGTLFFDIERIIEAKQPKAFILENVKGLTSHDKGETLKVILETLEKKLDYKVFHQVLNSKDYGLPQNRERIVN